MSFTLIFTQLQNMHGSWAEMTVKKLHRIKENY